MKKITVFFLCIMLGIFTFSGQVKAATPRVMVSDYSIKEGEVTAGEEFNLQVMLKNTAAKAVKNIKLTLSTENGELLPAEGAGTAYVSEIAADSEEKISFAMKAVSGLEEKSYKLSLKTEYESIGGYEYTVEDAIFIPVTLKQRVSVTDIMIPEEEIQLGDSVEIIASINNLGEGTLYNACARVSGYNIADQESYIGNIESGKTGTADVITRAVALYKQGEKNIITISYENQKGKVMEKEFLINVSEVPGEIMVQEPHYSDLEQVKTSTSKTATLKLALWIAAVITVVVALIFLWIRRMKRKKAILDEF